MMGVTNNSLPRAAIVGLVLPNDCRSFSLSLLAAIQTGCHFLRMVPPRESASLRCGFMPLPSTGF